MNELPSYGELVKAAADNYAEVERLQKRVQQLEGTIHNQAVALEAYRISEEQRLAEYMRKRGVK